MGCLMFDADLKPGDAASQCKPDAVKIMYDFLELSARPGTSGQAVEDHLLGSLAIALHGREVAN